VNHLKYELNSRRGDFCLRGTQTLEFFRLGIFGPSGAGKSTFLDLISGLDYPGEGNIIFNNRTWFDSENNINIATRQRGVGVQFQSAALFPHLTVKDNLEFSGREKTDSDHGRHIIERLGLAPLLNRYPDQLSGGERRRAALAQALYSRPRLLCLDEPFSGLDDRLRRRLLSDFSKILHDEKLPAIVVSHRPEVILGLCESVVPVRAGNLGESVAVSSFFQQHDQKYRDILGSVNYFKGICCESSGELTVLESNNGLKIKASHDPRLSAGDSVLITIPGDSILLARDLKGTVSARNRFTAEVTEVEKSHSPIVRLESSNEPLVAALTPTALKELNITPGSKLEILIKSRNVRILPL
jgi:molybdate transport system ATP-binding protein